MMFLEHTDFHRDGRDMVFLQCERACGGSYESCLGTISHNPCNRTASLLCVSLCDESSLQKLYARRDDTCLVSLYECVNVA